jgi:hypothetical protein
MILGLQGTGRQICEDLIAKPKPIARFEFSGQNSQIINPCPVRAFQILDNIRPVMVFNDSMPSGNGNIFDRQLSVWIPSD